MYSVAQRIPLGNRLLLYTLGASLMVHLMLLPKVPFVQLVKPKKDMKLIEVAYQQKKKVAAKEGNDKSKNEEIKTLKKEKLTDDKVLLKKTATNSPVIKEVNKLSSQISLTNKPVQLDRLPVERRITIPPLKSEKINNPFYLNYYQLVRTKIRNEAYRNYVDSESGQVYLTFVLLADGTLKQLKLIEEKTSAQSNLRNIGLKSIRESNPFPPFPPDLKYPELSFNVEISFELKQKTAK